MSSPVNLGTKPTENDRFEYTKDVDGVRKTVRGEKAENGWIITIEKQWEEKNPINDTSEWKSNSWKYISRQNPLEALTNKDAKTEEENAVSDVLNSVAAAQGDIMV